MEWYIVFTMAVFLPLGVMIPTDSNEIREDLIGCGVYLLLLSIFFLCQPWLYFKILHQGERVGCVAKVFAFYTGINVNNGKWITFNKVIAIFSCTTGCLFGPVSLGLILYGLYFGMTSRSSNVDEDADDDEDGEKIYSSVVGRIFLGLCGVSAIAFVEKTIQINHIDLSEAPFNATSQLISFLVGLFSFLSVAWSCVKKWRKSGNQPVPQA